MKIDQIVARQFIFFALVGTGGFVVDSAVLYSLIYGVGTDFYSGRLVSYLAAATFTWWFNRCYTFECSKNDKYFNQWFKFISLNAFGGVINYLVYAAMMLVWQLALEHPVIGVAFGSVAGLAVNFTLSSKFVFKRVQ